jgi:hypothetical protein
MPSGERAQCRVSAVARKGAPTMSTRSRLQRVGLLVAILAAAMAGATLTPAGSAIAKEVTEVFIANTDPIPVEVADGQPVQGGEVVNPDPHEFYSCQVIYEVPQGKRLNLEYVSVVAEVVGDGNAAAAEFRGGMEIPVWMHSTHTPGQTGGEGGIDSPTYVYWSGSETVQAFVTGSLGACAFVSQPAQDFGEISLFTFWWSGHLVDLP